MSTDKIFKTTFIAKPDVALANQNSAKAPIKDPNVRYRPSAPHLQYHGGKLLTSPKFANIYLGSYWKSHEGNQESKYLNDFGKTIVKGEYTSIWKEYGVGKGSFLGSMNDSSTRTPSAIDESDIQSIVKKNLATGQLPKPDGQTVYSVFLPPKVELIADGDATSYNGLGGYHGSYVDRSGTPVYYAAIAYSKDGNGINFTNVADQNMGIVASHEWTEAATDPDVNRGKLGWYDSNYGEIGDIPIAMGMPIKDVYGVVDGFTVQKEWSNRDKTAEVTESQPLR